MSENAALPVVDIGAFEQDRSEVTRVVRDTHRALSERGFVYVCGHGIDAALIDQAFAVSKRFFT
jgi:isopenicillin N synthase-like dioxygenase